MLSDYENADSDSEAMISDYENMSEDEEDNVSDEGSVESDMEDDSAGSDEGSAESKADDDSAGSEKGPSESDIDDDGDFDPSFTYSAQTTRDESFYADRAETVRQKLGTFLSAIKHSENLSD